MSVMASLNFIFIYENAIISIISVMYMKTYVYNKFSTSWIKIINEMTDTSIYILITELYVAQRFHWNLKPTLFLRRSHFKLMQNCKVVKIISIMKLNHIYTCVYTYYIKYMALNITHLNAIEIISLSCGKSSWLQRLLSDHRQLSQKIK